MNQNLHSSWYIQWKFDFDECESSKLAETFIEKVNSCNAEEEISWDIHWKCDFGRRKWVNYLRHSFKMRFGASSHHGHTPLYFGPAGPCQDPAWYVFCIWRIPDAHPVVARKLVGRPNPVPLATDTRLAHTSANSNFRVACISYLAHTQRIPSSGQKALWATTHLAHTWIRWEI